MGQWELFQRIVKNARVLADIQAMKLLSTLAASEPIATVKAAFDVQQPAIDPEALWNLNQALPYHVSITWSDALDCFDVVFHHLQATAAPQQKQRVPRVEGRSWQPYGNNPLQTKQTSQLVQQLRSFLKEKLPEFMVPAAIVLMGSLPRTLNGKVNRRALPAPSQTRPTHEALTAPRTPTEKQLAAIWSQALGLDRIGIHDNFISKKTLMILSNSRYHSYLNSF